MVNRAQLSQERSRQRREELLRAAVKVFAEGGSKAVTHRAVSHRAGLPPATTTYYFESIDELLQEAMKFEIDIWREQLAEYDRQLHTLTLDETLKFLSGSLGSRPEGEAIRELRVFLEAAADPQLLNLARDSADLLENFMTGLFERAQISEPRVLARGACLLVNGSTVRQASEPLDLEAETRELHGALRALTASHLMAAGEIDAVISGKSASSQ